MPCNRCGNTELQDGFYCTECHSCGICMCCPCGKPGCAECRDFILNQAGLERDDHPELTTDEALQQGVQNFLEEGRLAQERTQRRLSFEEAKAWVFEKYDEVFRKLAEYERQEREQADDGDH